MIGSGAIVGARSVVTRSKVPENSICIGSPAKVVRENVIYDRKTTVRQPLIGDLPQSPKLHPPFELERAAAFVALRRFIAADNEWHSEGRATPV